MAKEKRGLFEWLTGSQADEDYTFDELEQGGASYSSSPAKSKSIPITSSSASAELVEEEEAGELAVDVYQTPEAIVVKALIAGVHPNSVDISLTREMLTISGTREDEREVDEEHYFQRELYWGSFSRTILLPEEVDVDMAEASERHGVLMIRLPKINKKKQTKLKVRAR